LYASQLPLVPPKTLTAQNLCSHIVLGDFIIPSDEGVGEQTEKIRLLLLEATATFKKAGLKILVNIGVLEPDSSTSFGAVSFSKASAKNDSRVNLVSRMLQITKKRGFDGVNLFWGFPGCPNV